jgi:hypothetical protein
VLIGANIMEAKQDCKWRTQWRSILNLQKRSLLSTRHTVYVMHLSTRISFKKTLFSMLQYSLHFQMLDHTILIDVKATINQ